jgi:hypothetical protein
VSLIRIFVLLVLLLKRIGRQNLRHPEKGDSDYGELEALIRREIRKLALARSLGRIEKPSRLKLLFKIWLDNIRNG